MDDAPRRVVEPVRRFSVGFVTISSEGIRVEGVWKRFQRATPAIILVINNHVVTGPQLHPTRWFIYSAEYDCEISSTNYSSYLLLVSGYRGEIGPRALDSILETSQRKRIASILVRPSEERQARDEHIHTRNLHFLRFATHHGSIVGIARIYEFRARRASRTEVE